jgi:hypothetical protein
MEASRKRTPRPVSPGVGEPGRGGGVGGGDQGFFWEEEEPDRPVILTEASGPNSPQFVRRLVGFAKSKHVGTNLYLYFDAGPLPALNKQPGFRGRF